MTDRANTYRLDQQVGFLLRRAHQRHTAIFGERMPAGLTPTQFSALARLLEGGPLSQNLLGREVAVDAATIKGVVDRLTTRGLVAVAPDPSDLRRLTVSLTEDGRRFAEACLPIAVEVSEATLAPLGKDEQRALLATLSRVAGAEEPHRSAGRVS
jgi:MarR family transcriptional regulator, lower aerobic nicotinate degradation pathway regulator